MRNKKDGLLGKKSSINMTGIVKKLREAKRYKTGIFQFCSKLNIDDIDTFITIKAVDIKQGHFFKQKKHSTIGLFCFHI